MTNPGGVVVPAGADAGSVGAQGRGIASGLLSAPLTAPYTSLGHGMTPAEYEAGLDWQRAVCLANRARLRERGICWNSSPDRIHYLDVDGTCPVCGSSRLIEISGRVTPMKPHPPAPCLGCGTLTVERVITGWDSGWQWKTNGTSPFCATCQEKRIQGQRERVGIA